MDRDSQTETVRVVPATLVDAVIVALESDEFRQIRGELADGTNGRCVWGVAADVIHRAGFVWGEDDVVTCAVIDAARRLGFADVGHANDAGVTFAQFAQAMREVQAEQEEQGDS